MIEITVESKGVQSVIYVAEIREGYAQFFDNNLDKLEEIRIGTIEDNRSASVSDYISSHGSIVKTSKIENLDLTLED